VPSSSSEITPKHAVRCLVAGHVQGVWYRAATAQRAEQLSLSGWAKNLPDGRVEVVIVGESHGIAKLCEWLWEGSSSASVSGITVEVWRDSVSSGFQTL